jgi:hypothetical protein
VITYIFGRIYTITFLANLIARKALGNVHYVTDTLSPGLEILPMFGSLCRLVPFCTLPLIVFPFSGTNQTISTEKTSTAVTDNVCTVSSTDRHGISDTLTKIEYTYSDPALRSRVNDVKEDCSLHAGDDTPTVP